MSVKENSLHIFWHWHFWGVGDGPYSQNTPESINDLIKDWNNFKAQVMDNFVLSLYVVQNFMKRKSLPGLASPERRRAPLPPIIQQPFS